MAASPRAEQVEALLASLYRDEVRHSRLIWRLEADRRYDWPYPGLWHDPAGATLIDLTGHPRLDGGPSPDRIPWFQAGAEDGEALELLLGVRLPPLCEVLLDQRFHDRLARLGDVHSAGALEVHACAPGQLGEAALPLDPTRLTPRQRALVAEDDWRPDDLAEECDETRDGVRWAIVRDGHIVSRLLVQTVSRHVRELADVQTRADRRRRGYGAGLVQAVTRRLHERGLTVTYSVHPDNAPSRALAQAVGFRPVFTWERYALIRR
jgi:GNAT superfamily N-acetyltransferase